MVGSFLWFGPCKGEFSPSAHHSGPGLRLEVVSGVVDQCTSQSAQIMNVHARVSCLVPSLAGPCTSLRLWVNTLGVDQRNKGSDRCTPQKPFPPTVQVLLVCLSLSIPLSRSFYLIYFFAAIYQSFTVLISPIPYLTYIYVRAHVYVVHKLVTLPQ